jgi:hypothetical protein
MPARPKIRVLTTRYGRGIRSHDRDLRVQGPPRRSFDGIQDSAVGPDGARLTGCDNKDDPCDCVNNEGEPCTCEIWQG